MTITKEDVMRRDFTVRETNIAKGAACMLLLFHHLFHNRWDMFYNIGGFEPPLIGRAASFARVCVAMFVILSGFGLARSAEKSEKVGLKYTYNRLIKLYMPFWAIFIIFVPLGFVLGRSPLEIYGQGYTFLKHIAIDWFGLNYMFDPNFIKNFKKVLTKHKKKFIIKIVRENKYIMQVSYNGYYLSLPS